MKALGLWKTIVSHLPYGKGWSRDICLTIFSAFSLILCFPPFQWSVLAWFALIPFLCGISGRSPRHAFFLGGVLAWGFFSGTFYWIWTVPGFTIINYLLLAGYLSLYGAIFGYGIALFQKGTSWFALLMGPTLWVTLEFFRGHMDFLSAPWMYLAHTQIDHLPLLQISVWTGAWGVSFLIVLVNVGIWQVGCALLAPNQSLGVNLFSKSHRWGVPLGVIFAAFCGVWGYGLIVLEQEAEGRSIPVAIIQGHFTVTQKWDTSYRESILNWYEERTREASQHSPLLIVWPETAVPGDVLHQKELRQRIMQLAVETHSYLLVGNAESAKFSKGSKRHGKKRFNSLVLFSPDGGVVDQYRKIRLVPFGEYMPYKDLVDWSAIISRSLDDTVPGEDYTIFTIPGLSFGAMLCWESTFPEITRQIIAEGAQLLVNAADESWFGDTTIHEHFLASTVFRAVEHGRAIVRSTNMGISALIDPIGRQTVQHGIRASTGTPRGIVEGEVVLRSQHTFYAQFGDSVLLLLWVVGLSLAGLTRFISREPGRLLVPHQEY